MFVWMPPTRASDTRPPPNNESETQPSPPVVFVRRAIVPLRAIRDSPGIPLRWVVQVKEDLFGLTCDLRCELRCGKETVGLLRYQLLNRREPPDAQARTKEGTWLFRGYGSKVEIETDTGDRRLLRPF